jgi:hypothetical protein
MELFEGEPKEEPQTQEQEKACYWRHDGHRSLARLRARMINFRLKMRVMDMEDALPLVDGINVWYLGVLRQ